MNLSPLQTIKKVAVVENQFEAQLVDSILTQRNIPHIICSYHDTAYDGLFQVQMGWGEIRSPIEFREEILHILETLRSEIHGI